MLRGYYRGMRVNQSKPPERFVRPAVPSAPPSSRTARLVPPLSWTASHRRLVAALVAPTSDAVDALPLDPCDRRRRFASGLSGSPLESNGFLSIVVSPRRGSLARALPSASRDLPRRPSTPAAGIAGSPELRAVLRAGARRFSRCASRKFRLACRLSAVVAPRRPPWETRKPKSAPCAPHPHPPSCPRPAAPLTTTLRRPLPLLPHHQEQAVAPVALQPWCARLQASHLRRGQEGRPCRCLPLLLPPHFVGEGAGVGRVTRGGSCRLQQVLRQAQC